MTTTIETYIDKLTISLYNQIACYLDDKDDSELIADHFTDRMKKKKFENFQIYYFKTLNNSSNLDFREFKQQYALQFIDAGFTQHLQDNKSEIVRLIAEDNLSELYFRYFAKAQIRHKETVKEKNLGSFFTKVVHTFRPEDYTPLDIPMRTYFKLTEESYFVSFLVVSNAFKIWGSSRPQKIIGLKKELQNADKKHILQHDKLTDIKLLDLIFWSVADNEARKTKTISTNKYN